MVLRRVRTFLSVYNALMMEMRAEIVLWMLATTFPLIMMGVWYQAGESGKFALTAAAFAQYFTALFIIRQFTIVWVIYEFEGDVLQGRLSPYLLQPIDPVWRYVAQHTAERFTRMPFVAVLVGVLLVMVPDTRWSPGAGDLLLGALLTYLAFVLRFIIQYTFALLAFWTERAVAVENLWFMVYLFLSGLLGPLDVYSPTMRTIAMATPFPYMMYFPAQALLGRDPGMPWLWVLAILAGWIVLFLVINRLLWRVALKRYSAMGA
ncbi:MAG: ABC-2 family transporter protein [Phycisphaeraceae bacterium]